MPCTHPMRGGGGGLFGRFLSEVEELLQLRQQLRSGQVSSQELGIRLATLKLDLSDRKTKRFFKEKERKSLLETLTPAIAEAKMQRFLAEQAQEGVPEATKMEEPPVTLEEPKAGVARRRYKHYSDADLASLLREKDDAASGRDVEPEHRCVWGGVGESHITASLPRAHMAKYRLA
ncbi:unnamed protein product [Durusdinium trenchii]|uniref:Uncharacterized protein n=1 Tax=Durusdinium trenchii TaxID=1381693 RepID=A0ABP0JQU6_9DINO